ncbi:hypothetical protein B7P34_07615 [Streptosporangium nondiastaticum]|uniref:Tail assembly chaperone n=2 Tax=Actinomycetes TaxID=1760 RepID=A0A9X7JSW9_9ACTN|nr:hypothetical protein [Streptosporangium nondiastaticum]PSJ29358.1 hypothetical protein B7P34_07615 [Streptosporangium nondiastaticum]
MGTKFIEVDETHKGQPGVEEGVKTIEVGGQTITTPIFVQRIDFDDLAPEVTDNLTTVKFAVTVTEEMEDLTGEVDEDGSPVTEIREIQVPKWLEIDLGSESLKQYEEVMAPFFAAARETEAPVIPAPRKRRKK